MEVCNYDVRPFLGESNGASTANTRRSTGDHSDLALKPIQLWDLLIEPNIERSGLSFFDLSELLRDVTNRSISAFLECACAYISADQDNRLFRIQIPEPVHYPLGNELHGPRRSWKLLVGCTNRGAAADDVEELVGVCVDVPLVSGTGNKNRAEENEVVRAAGFARKDEANIQISPSLFHPYTCGGKLAEVCNQAVIVSLHQLLPG
jgi:hypothetical protein